jgi:hypothetical protein
MKFIIFISVLIGISSCSQFLSNKNYQKNEGENVTRSIASIVNSINVIPVVSEITLCQKSYSIVNWVTNHPNFIIESKNVNRYGLTYSYPDKILVSGLKINSPVAIKIQKPFINLKFPLLPSVPIVNHDSPLASNLLCKFLSENNSKIKLDQNLGVISGHHFKLNLRNKNIQIENSSLKELLPVSANQLDASSKQGAKTIVIYFDELYLDEMQRLEKILSDNNINVILQSLSSLPGLDANLKIPLECQGEFLDECYIDSINSEYLSPEFVMTLHGTKKFKSLLNSKLTPYIPGLIRANIRKLKNEGKIDYSLLVGSGNILSPFYVTQDHYHAHINNMPSAYIHTDLFYMIPQNPLTYIPNQMHFESLTSWLWSCKSSIDQKVRLKRWCEDHEQRFWPTPPLSAYRFGIYSPKSILFKYEGFYSPFFANLTLDQLVPVGRIPTQDVLFGKKDSAVANYVDKVEDWFQDLPQMKNNSYATYGGSTSDSWIYQSADSAQFKAAYGSNSKIYASEFFIPQSHCQGCEYIPGDNILSEISSSNKRVAWLLNGHGSSKRIQAPYAMGNIESHFHNEDFHAIGGYDIKHIHYKYPETNTFKQLENSGTIFGHVIANSCSASDFNLTDGSELERIFYTQYGSNQRSWAEQLISMKNSGAMNTLINSDVGWSNVDNMFNQSFMNATNSAWESCSNKIGDAYKLSVFNLIKAKKLQFQVYNRQFLGLPVNPIAKASTSCPTEVESN